MASNKRKLAMIAGAVIVLALVVVVGIKLIANQGDGKSGVERNTGICYVTLNFRDDASGGFEVDQVVPGKDELIKKLEKAGYKVEVKDTVFDSGIAGQQVNASKGKRFCSITYGLSEEEAENVYQAYENEYSEDDYYILARNVKYVYCFSDDKVFKTAGFDSLGTDGALTINHDNY